MSDVRDILVALQHADSIFPAGASAMSCGLETLVEDGHVTTTAQVENFLRGQLECRWAEFDRAVLVAAYRAGHDLDEVAHIDCQVEAQTLAAEARSGSHRSGRALLGVHVKLGMMHAIDYQAMISRAAAIGHGAVVQGLVWRATGISEPTAQVMSAHIFCIGLVGAALRLGVIGHIHAQSIVSKAHALIVQLLKQAPLELEHICAFSPQQEIALMRHETMSYRLFVN